MSMISTVIDTLPLNILVAPNIFASLCQWLVVVIIIIIMYIIINETKNDDYDDDNN